MQRKDPKKLSEYIDFNQLLISNRFLLINLFIQLVLPRASGSLPYLFEVVFSGKIRRIINSLCFSPPILCGPVQKDSNFGCPMFLATPSDRFLSSDSFQ